MTTALEGVCSFVEGNPGGEWEHFQFDALFMRDAVREVRALQDGLRVLTVQRDRAVDGYTKMSNWLSCANGEKAALQAEVQSLRGALMILEGFSHADRVDLSQAQAEIDRLLAAIPTINASSAVVKVASDGSISIVADHVEITGTVHA